MLEASVHAVIVSPNRGLIDPFGAYVRASLHHTSSSKASLVNLLLRYGLLGGKYYSLLYAQRKKVRPRGPTVETKFRYPVISCKL